MKVNLNKTIYMVKEFTPGTTVVFIRVSFVKIKSKATVILPMKMDDSTKENSLTT